MQIRLPSRGRLFGQAVAQQAIGAVDIFQTLLCLLVAAGGVGVVLLGQILVAGAQIH